MISDRQWLEPEWPLTDRVGALCTTRQSGVSEVPWDSFNQGLHVGDNPDHVIRNRRRLAQLAGLESGSIGWLDQVHGTRVVELTPQTVAAVPEADASFTHHPGVACAILTADCLPVVLADENASVVGAAHAGWRSLCGGVLENLIDSLGVKRECLHAWLGPAIGPERFEVGPEVREAFISQHPESERAFVASPSRASHYLADIYELARIRLVHAGVTRIQGGGLCTVSDPVRFFSYRRDGQTGRMATLAWLK